jgi:hypothetical protein
MKMNEQLHAPRRFSHVTLWIVGWLDNIRDSVSCDEEKKLWLYGESNTVFQPVNNYPPPTDGVSTLSQWWGLSAPETLRAMPAVA